MDRASFSRIGTSLAGIALCATLVVARPPTVAAASPNGGCGEGFTWITIEDLLIWRPQFPPALAAFRDQNHNGALCYRILPSTISPNSPEFGHLVPIDDRAPAR
jgi:hypothetical protein